MKLDKRVGFNAFVFFIIVDEALNDYIATLEGNHEHNADQNGSQKVEKSAVFVKLPHLPHLHLMRFQYDRSIGEIKLDDRFEFAELIDLDKYVQKKKDTPAKYKLYAVFVHSGDYDNGEYMVNINPYGCDEWYKFEDHPVSRCNKQEAVNDNYGGIDENVSLSAKHTAYRLVYVRESVMPMVLKKTRHTAGPLLHRLRI